LRLAVLLAKRRHREAEVAVDYCGFEIPDVFVVGYGMDDNGLHRQWPLIAQP
jgi:hypoxanthine phosphoribosyltransferase